MTSIEGVVKSSYQNDMCAFLDDLVLAYDEESEKKLKSDIKRIYERKKIPTAGDILGGIEDDNYDTFHGIAYTILKYKQSELIHCHSEDEIKGNSKIIGFDICEECRYMEECYNDVFENDVAWEFGDQTHPLHICNLLYSVLTDGDLCIYITRRDFYYHMDLLTSYDYGNSIVLDEYYRDSDNEDLIIVNHAQSMMFDDLYDRDDDGSCYRYGTFLLLKDPFKRKEREREGYYIE